jgi:hypothetical protein
MPMNGFLKGDGECERMMLTRALEEEEEEEEEEEGMIR